MHNVSLTKTFHFIKLHTSKSMSLAVLTAGLLTATHMNYAYADDDNTSSSTPAAATTTTTANPNYQGASTTIPSNFAGANTDYTDLMNSAEYQQAQSTANAQLNQDAAIYQGNAEKALGDTTANILNQQEDNSLLTQNAYSSPQWQDSNNSWGTSVTAGGNNSSLSGGCDPDVSKGLMNAQLNEIAGAKQLAANIIKKPDQTAFSKLMNSGCVPGLGTFIGFPSLNQLESLPGKLLRQICSAAQSMEQSYMSEYITGPMSSLSQNSNFSLGSIGGYSLGSVPLGVQVSGTQTTGGAGGIKINNDAATTAQNLGSDFSSQTNYIDGTSGNGGSGSMSQMDLLRYNNNKYNIDSATLSSEHGWDYQ